MEFFKDSFCVRLFTLCLNSIAWWLRSTEGYTYSHNKQEKLTHLLYVDDLKTYLKSAQKALLITKTTKSMFEDNGLFWGLDKCATINIVHGKLQTSISDTEELKILDTDDHYKFLGKHENSVQLEQPVCKEAASQYLKRLSVIWSSNISIPRIGNGTTETKTITTPSPTSLKELLRSKIIEKYIKEAEKQKWLGGYTKKRQDKELPPTANQILKKWKHTPDIVYRVTDRQTDRHLYLVIKLRVVPSGAKSNLLSTGALSTKIHYLHGKYYIKGTTTSI